MDISAPSDEASPSIVNPVSTFPTAKASKKIVGIFLTRTIQEYCEGKIIDDHDQFATLKLNFEKLKAFMEMLEDGQISQGIKLRFLETLQEAELKKLSIPQHNLKSSISTLE